MALNTHRQMGVSQMGAGKAMEKLSSGFRINRGADDAAGLAVSEKMRGQIRGLAQASRNAQDGISLIQTAEGALNEVSAMLVRMKELAVQKATGTYNADDIANTELELAELTTQIGAIKTGTKFNTLDAFGAIKIAVSDDDATTNLTTIAATFAAPAATTVAGVETQITAVNKDRAQYGAHQNALESIVRNLDNKVENLQAAESRIRDTDMAREMMHFTKNNILLQASQAMLAQANQAPQGVLQILR